MALLTLLIGEVTLELAGRFAVLLNTFGAWA
jgi:hypothetical protein